MAEPDRLAAVFLFMEQLIPALVASGLAATGAALLWVCFDICRWIWHREDAE